MLLSSFWLNLGNKKSVMDNPLRFNSIQLNSISFEDGRTQVNCIEPVPVVHAAYQA